MPSTVYWGIVELEWKIYLKPKDVVMFDYVKSQTQKI